MSFASCKKNRFISFNTSWSHFFELFRLSSNASYHCRFRCTKISSQLVVGSFSRLAVTVIRLFWNWYWRQNRLSQAVTKMMQLCYQRQQGSRTNTVITVDAPKRSSRITASDCSTDSWRNQHCAEILSLLQLSPTMFFSLIFLMTIHFSALMKNDMIFYFRFGKDNPKRIILFLMMSIAW